MRFLRTKHESSLGIGEMKAIKCSSRSARSRMTSTPAFLLAIISAIASLSLSFALPYYVVPVRYPKGNFATDIREIQIAVGSKNAAAYSLTVDTGSGFVDFGCNTPHTGAPVSGGRMRVCIPSIPPVMHLFLITVDAPNLRCRRTRTQPAKMRVTGALITDALMMDALTLTFTLTCMCA